MKVGKTHLANSFVGKPIPPYYTPTIGTDYASKAVIIDEHPVTIHICDLSGNSVFNMLTTPCTFHHVAAAMLVFDVTNSYTFHEMSSVIDKMIINGAGPKDIPFLLVGNKADLKDNRQVSYDTGKQFAEARGMPFIETSALTGQNVEYAFILLATMYLKKKDIELYGKPTNLIKMASVNDEDDANNSED